MINLYKKVLLDKNFSYDYFMAKDYIKIYKRR